ncbi:dynamin family protein [Caldicellulosiruptor acetigenus]|uniref:dynamin family protein n=1 Tax=Caldicellulosiruptor acetigenus TaxID=301953 RepID=UPI0003F755CB|nr:dynamin family protein [Caldicellulosiruptor acetigenus]WAM36932.1 dynamin family protein [Caldicellulosiruptor acetigenus]
MLQQLDFSTVKQELLELIEQAEKIIDEETLLNRLKSAKDRLEREKLNILVVGEFSRGKSTFINALLEEPVLPSKVNPTTAAITIVKGGPNKKITVYYSDGTIKELKIEDEPPNKFLNNIITAESEGVYNIEKVEIEWPSMLEKIDGIIVDTPGVNDLDETREQITYGYLSEADACIVILDSQQPLSQSEINFINQKILKEDIIRILFVINRVDEIDDDPNGPNIKRIVEYVKESIKKNVPDIKEPRVFAISSKQALRARYKKDDSAKNWNDSFCEFEKKLIEFANDRAFEKRLPEHLNRLGRLCHEAMSYYENKRIGLRSSKEQLESEIKILFNKQNLIELKRKNLMTYMENQRTELERRVSSRIKEDLTQFKMDIFEKAKSKMNEKDTLENLLKQEVNKAMREILQRIDAILYQFRVDILNYINREITREMDRLFEDELLKIKKNGYKKDYELNTNVPAVLSKQTDDLVVDVKIDDLDNPSYNFSLDGSVVSDDERIGIEILSRGALGFIGGALFGPIGFFAGLIGGGKVGEKLTEFIVIKKLEEKRQREFERNLSTKIDEIIKNAEKIAKEIVDKELMKLRLYAQNYIDEKIGIIKSMIEEKNNQLILKQEDIDKLVNQTQAKQQQIKKILFRLREIGKEVAI